MNNVQVTLSRIKGELNNLDLCYNELQHILPSSHNGLNWRLEVRVSKMAAGLIIHSYYTCIENIFELIVRDLYRTELSGLSWHKDLISLIFFDINDQEKIFANQYTYLWVDELRKFRHVVVKNYSFNLKEEGIESITKGIYNNHDSFVSELNNWMDKKSIEAKKIISENIEVDD